MLGVLGNTDQSVASYVWRAWLISFVPSLVIGLLSTVVLDPSSDKAVPSVELDAVWLGVLALIAPWLETLLMWPILCLLRIAIHRTCWVALASALIWGYFHSRFGFAWCLSAIWMFFVFSLCFLAWEKKSPEKAYVVTALLHTCQNVPAALYLSAGLLMGDAKVIQPLSF